MRKLRMSFTAKRRARLAMKVERLERLESRHTITEPISVFALSVNAMGGLARLGLIDPHGGGRALSVLARPGQPTAQGQRRANPGIAAPTNFLAIAIGSPARHPASAAGGTAPVQDTMAPAKKQAPADDWLTFSSSPESESAETGLSTPWHPVSPPGGGGALPPRGGSGGPSIASTASRGAITPVYLPGSIPGANNAGASSALLSALGFGAGAGVVSAAIFPAPPGTRAAAAGTTVTRNGLAAALPGGGSVAASVGGSVNPLTSPAFELKTLDYNDGSVMVPGFEQLATPGGSVDLRAQVRDSATGTYTYTWNTSGLTDATSISGASTYDLTFQWDTSVSTANAESTTLTVTDPNSNQVSQTYTFWVPAGTGTATGGTTWNNTTLNPGLLQASAPAFGSQNVSVVAATGALETSINLPSYNPTIPGLSLEYDSLAANALPIIVAEHALSPSLSTPSEVSAQLTFDGTAGSTYYYSTSALRPGDIVQIGLQATNAATLDTGSYPYTMTIAEIRGSTPTTFTYPGTATVENAAEDPTFSALGAGWTVGGLEKIIPATGGVILDEGAARSRGSRAASAPAGAPTRAPPERSPPSCSIAIAPTP
jgi:hypothetical protein